MSFFRHSADFSIFGNAIHKAVFRNFGESKYLKFFIIYFSIIIYSNFIKSLNYA